MSKDLETILDRCLDEIKRGKSIEYCLDLYPEYASELKSLLRLAKSIEEIPKPKPRKEAINLTLMRIGEVLSSRKEREMAYKKILHPLLFRPVLTKVLAFTLILVVVIWTMGMLSAQSLPGHPLYPIKLVTERVRFSLTRSAEGKAELRLTFAGARLEELVKTVEQRGVLDESLLGNLLKEAELALDEARPVGEDRFTLFLTKLNYFTAYQKAVLEQLRPRVPTEKRTVLDTAIQICRERCRCMEELMRPERPEEGNREWHPGCRWR